MPQFLRRSAISVVVMSLTLLVGAGCKPKIGQKCSAGQATCVDAHNALACGTDSTFAAVPCKGPQGCQQDRSTKKVQCDDSIADEGDGCMASQAENWACSVDKKKALICEDGKFKLNYQCRGPKACQIKHDWLKMQDTVECDTHLQAKGDPCQKPGTFACSADYKTMLQCKDGKFDLYRYCRGAQGCTVKESGDFNCDESIAELNDPCGVPGMLVCAADAKSELKCEGGKFVRARECKKAGCHITAYNRIDCQ
jgi:hypothetical protein